jgi:hypothetical protein
MADAPGSEPGARTGMGVRLSPWSLSRGVDWSQVPARSHEPYHVGSNPTAATVPLRPGQCPGGSHKPAGQVQLLGPQLLNRAVSSTGRAVVSHAKGCRFESCTAHSRGDPRRLASSRQQLRSAGVTAARLLGKEEVRVRPPGGPLPPPYFSPPTGEGRGGIAFVWGRMFQGPARLPCKQSEMGSIPIVSTPQRACDVSQALFLLVLVSAAPAPL